MKRDERVVPLLTRCLTIQVYKKVPEGFALYVVMLPITGLMGSIKV